MMKVLVTGATGGLGRNLCGHLLSHGYAVRATGRNTAAGEDLVRQGCDFVPADLSHGAALDALVKDCEAIAHCAALSSPWGAPAAFRAANVTTTTQLLTACIRAGTKRFVHVSTSSVYFNFRDRLGIKETDPVAETFVNAYATTKYEAEQEVAKAGAQGLETVIIRPRGIFGPHDSVVFPKIIHAGGSKVLPLPRNGTAIIDMTYVGNVAHALRLALEADTKATGKIYNITNGDPWQVSRLIDTLFGKIGIRPRVVPVPWPLLSLTAGLLEKISALKDGKEPMLTRYTAALLARSQTLDINAARTGLGYSPQTDMNEGLSQFAAWWKEGKCR